MLGRGTGETQRTSVRYPGNSERGSKSLPNEPLQHVPEVIERTSYHNDRAEVEDNANGADMMHWMKKNSDASCQRH